jgi:hypothetical protein
MPQLAPSVDRQNRRTLPGRQWHWMAKLFDFFLLLLHAHFPDVMSDDFVDLVCVCRHVAVVFQDQGIDRRLLRRRRRAGWHIVNDRGTTGQKERHPPNKISFIDLTQHFFPPMTWYWITEPEHRALISIASPPTKRVHCSNDIATDQTGTPLRPAPDVNTRRLSSRRPRTALCGDSYDARRQRWRMFPGSALYFTRFAKDRGWRLWVQFFAEPTIDHPSDMDMNDLFKFTQNRSIFTTSS